MLQHFFIAGTDCGVGKSFVTCALLRDLCARGIDAVGYKPVACGDRTEARDIREAMGQPAYKLEDINPVYLRTLAEPIIAAEMERKTIGLAALVQGYEQLAARHNVVLVDGSGPWETPLAPGLSMADLAAALKLPVLLVVNNRPGAAGLVQLTLRAIRSRGLECRGVILNHIGEEWSTASVTNSRVISDLTGTKIPAELIHGQDYIDAVETLGL